MRGSSESEDYYEVSDASSLVFRDDASYEDYANNQVFLGLMSQHDINTERHLRKRMYWMIGRLLGMTFILLIVTIATAITAFLTRRVIRNFLRRLLA